MERGEQGWEEVRAKKGKRRRGRRLAGRGRGGAGLGSWAPRGAHREPAAAGAGAARGAQWRAALRRGRCSNTRLLTAKLTNSALVPAGSRSPSRPGAEAARAALRANMAAE